MKEKEESLFSGKENVDSFLFLNVNLSSFLITYIRTQPVVASKPKNVPGAVGGQVLPGCGPELSPPTTSKKMPGFLYKSGLILGFETINCELKTNACYCQSGNMLLQIMLTQPNPV
jgi:hypothetical protein